MKKTIYLILVLLTGCKSLHHIDYYDANEYEALKNRNPHVYNSTVTISDSVYNNYASYNLRGNMYYPKPQHSEDMIKVYHYRDYVFWQDFTVDPAWTYVSSVFTPFIALGAIGNEELRYMFVDQFKGLLPGMNCSQFSFGNAGLDNPEITLTKEKRSKKNNQHTERVDFNASKSWTAFYKGKELPKVGYRKQSIDLTSIAKDADENKAVDFEVKVRIGDKDDKVTFDGKLATNQFSATEFVFQYDVRDFYKILEDHVISTPDGCEVYAGEKNNLKKVGVTPYKKLYDGFDPSIPMQLVQLRKGDIISPIIELNSTTNNRLTQFTLKSASINFSSDIPNSKLLIRASQQQEHYFPFAYSKTALLPDGDDTSYGKITATCDSPNSDDLKVEIDLDNVVKNGGTRNVHFSQQQVKVDFKSEIANSKLVFLPSHEEHALPFSYSVAKTVCDGAATTWDDFKIICAKNGYISPAISLDMNSIANRGGTTIKFVEKRVPEIVTSTPPGADVWIRGEKVGTTPYQGGQKFLVPENYSLNGAMDSLVEVRKLGFQSAQTKWDNSNVKNRKAHFDLISLPSGYVKFISNQDGVDVYVDGELHGQIQQAGKPMNFKLPIGKHTFMARKEFFRPITISVNLREKDIFSYEFNLVKASDWVEDKPEKYTVKQATGSLKVVTSRSDLTVEIEGAKKIPPFELENVPAGSYTIRIKGPGVNKTKTIVIEDQKEIFIDLDTDI